MDGLSARVRSRRSRVRGDDSRRRRSRRFGVFLFIRLLRDDGDGASSRPRDPRVRRPAAAAAALARARFSAAGVVARFARLPNRGSRRGRRARYPAATDWIRPFSVAAADARARSPLANPGDAPTLAPFDVAALARACVAAAALVAPRAPHAATRAWRPFFETEITSARGLEQKNAFVAAAGCAAENLVAETVGREAAVAVCQLMDCEERGEGGGASRGEGGGRGAADGGSSSAVSSSAVSSSRPRPRLVGRRDEGARGGNEWTRRVALHLSLDAWVTPAKATLAVCARATTVVARGVARRGRDGTRRRDARARSARGNAAERARRSFAARRDHDDDDDDDGGGGGREGGPSWIVRVPDLVDLG